MYENGYLLFSGVDKSRVRLIRFDNQSKLTDIDPMTVSERDISALRTLYGIMLENGSVHNGTAVKANGSIELDLFLELTGHSPETPDDRIELAKHEISRYNRLIGRPADKSIQYMIDLVYHGGNNDTVSFTSPYIDILLRTVPA